ncbi:MAG: serine/threonine-protein kinase [Planctomycetota bacterium]
MTFAQPFKDYEILERIGSGAMGTVFKARQKRLDRIVALKVLKPTLARNAKFVDRLRREARIVASLNHPDIVAGYDLGEEGGYHYFVMEFVEGTSLATLLREWGVFPEEQVLDVATRVASALDHAFKKGVIHRDIKPGNILIDKQGRAKLTDLGLAKAPEDVTITQEGATVGTPQYISPEQARDPSKVDVRSDLYSLGATLFHMSTGQPPFPGSTLANVIHDVVHRRAPSATAINPGLSDGLSLVIRKLLAKDPDLRYQTPSELLADLQRVRRAERPQVDVDALAAEDAVAVDGRHKLRAVILAVVAVVAVGAWLAWRGSRTAAPAERNSTQTFLTRVQAAVSEAEGWRGKLRALMRGAADASNDEERRAVADLRSGILIPWQEALVQFVRERRAGVPAFVLEPAHWRDPVQLLRRETVEAFERNFGIAHAELPAPLARALDVELERLDAEVGIRTGERDQNLLAAYRGHLEGEVAAAWRALLEVADFAGAERALRTGMATFFGEQGRPGREHLPPTARVEVDRVEAAASADALAQIDRAEAAAADALRRARDEALVGLRAQLLDGADPYLLRRRFESWCQDLAARHPSSAAFRTGADPWPQVLEAQLGFRETLAAAIAVADRQRVRAHVQLAVGALLADGDATQEIRWLRERSIDDDAVRALRERWATFVEDAHAARDWLLEALIGRLGGRTFTVGSNLAGRSFQVAVRKEGGRCELVERDGARSRRLSLAALRVSELLALVPARGDDEGRIDRGLAIWLYAGGETSLATGQLSKDDDTFFGEQIAPVLQAVLDQRFGDEPGARAELAHLRADYSNMPVAELRSALDAFDDRFGHTAVARASERVLSDLRAHLRATQQRQEILGALQGNVSPGLDVRIVGEARARVSCAPATAEGLVLAAGWQRSAGCLSFSSTDLHLEAARQHALVLADGLSTEHGVSFVAMVEFGAQAEQPRLYLFEIHGVGVALGLIATGEPFATVVAAEDLAREKVLHRGLERELDVMVEPRAGAPSVVLGARHRLQVDVGVQQSRLVASVRLDGVELARDSVVRPPKVAARVVAMPLQPLSLWSVEIEGQP